MESIASYTREQKMASEDIAQNIENIARMAEENLAAIQGNSVAAQHMENLASTVRNMTGRFRL
jgi:methyl-accepting chemotaxis protein